MWQIVFAFLTGLLCAVIAHVLYIFSSAETASGTSTPVKREAQQSAFRIPIELKQLLVSPGLADNLKKKESCVALNLLLQFVFQEIRHTRGFRRWVLRKLRTEFCDLLSNFAASRILRDIRIVRLDVGCHPPVVKSLQVSNVQLSPNEDSFEELDLLMDIDYHGGFEVLLNLVNIIDSGTCLRVKVAQVSGELRCQITRNPFTHWCVAFTQEPRIDFEIDSKLRKRHLPQLVPLIINQFRRMVRKKHVLPAYKIRFEPLFKNPLYQPTQMNAPAMEDVQITGCLCMSGIRCGRLNVSVVPLGHTDMFLQFTMSDKLLSVHPNSDIPFALLLKLRKTSTGGNVGILFRRSYGLKKSARCVEVIEVAPNSPAENCGLKPGDLMLSINGTVLHSAGQATKLLSTNAKEYDVLVERVLRDDDDDEGEKKEETSYYAGTLSRSESDLTSLPVTATPHLSKAVSLCILRDLEASVSVAADGRKRSASADNVSTAWVELNGKSGVKNEAGEPCPPFISFNEPKPDDSAMNAKHASNMRLEKCTASFPICEAFSVDEPVVVPLQEKNSCLTISLCTKSASTSVATPVAFVSLFISDILRECNMTDSDTYVDRFMFKAIGNATVPAKLRALSQHPGFDANLCLGDVEMVFQWYPSTSCDDLENELFGDRDFVCIQSNAVASAAPTVDEAVSDHNWSSKQFSEPTLCLICLRKIWLRNALQCASCSAVIHKKCLSKVDALGPCGQIAVAVGNDDVKGDAADEEAIEASAYVDPEKETNVATAPAEGSNKSSATNNAVVGKRWASMKLRRPGMRLGRSKAKAAVKAPTTSPALSSKSEDVDDVLKTLSSELAANEDADFGDDWNFRPLLYTKSGTYNEHVIKAAKHMGKSLFSDLPLKERKAKINRQIDRLQAEIDKATNARLELMQQKRNVKGSTSSGELDQKMAKCDETVQGLAVLMLHYCAGLQNCQEVEQDDAAADALSLEDEAAAPAASVAEGETVSDVDRCQ